MVSLDHTVLETWSSVHDAKQLLEGMQQNKTPYKIMHNAWSVLCRKMLCNILTRMLNSSIHRLFALQKLHAQCNW